MRFKKRGTGEAVVVCCCILHNMRKVAKQRDQNIQQHELQQQMNIGQNILDAYQGWRGPRQTFRIQNMLLQDHFN